MSVSGPDLGVLTAGETRTITAPCVTRTPGQQKCDVRAEADGFDHHTEA